MNLKITSKLEQLLHFRSGPIWDGNLISKQHRDELAQDGFIDRISGFQFLTGSGVRILKQLGYLHEESWRDS